LDKLDGVAMNNHIDDGILLNGEIFRFLNLGQLAALKYLLSWKRGMS